MKTDQIVELLLEVLKEKSSDKEVTNSGKAIPFEIGEKYFIRTITYHSTGELKDIVGDFLILKKGAWIADSGSFNEAMKKGIDKVESSEIEPYETEWIININSIVDACVYPYKLPDTQK